MTKGEIISKISRETRCNGVMVKIIVNSLLKNIIEALSNGEKVKFAGFGTFEPRTRAARTGRNPQTNEAVHIPTRVTPSFKASSSLKAAVTKPIK